MVKPCRLPSRTRISPRSKSSVWKLLVMETSACISDGASRFSESRFAVPAGKGEQGYSSVGEQVGDGGYGPVASRGDDYVELLRVVQVGANVGGAVARPYDHLVAVLHEGANVVEHGPVPEAGQHVVHHQ